MLAGRISAAFHAVETMANAERSANTYTTGLGRRAPAEPLVPSRLGASMPAFRRPRRVHVATRRASATVPAGDGPPGGHGHFSRRMSPHPRLSLLGVFGASACFTTAALLSKLCAGYGIPVTDTMLIRCVGQVHLPAAPRPHARRLTSPARADVRRPRARRLTSRIRSWAQVAIASVCLRLVRLGWLTDYRRVNRLVLVRSLVDVLGVTLCYATGAMLNLAIAQALYLLAAVWTIPLGYFFQRKVPQRIDVLTAALCALGVALCAHGHEMDAQAAGELARRGLGAGWHTHREAGRTLRRSHSRSSGLGFGLGLLSGACHAGAYALTRRIAERAHFLQIVNMFGLVGVVALLARAGAGAIIWRGQLPLSSAAAAFRASARPHAGVGSWRLADSHAGMATIGVLGQALLNHAAQRCEPGTVAVLRTADLLFALAYDWAVFGEAPIHASTFIGVGLIITSALLRLYSEKRAEGPVADAELREVDEIGDRFVSSDSSGRRVFGGLFGAGGAERARSGRTPKRTASQTRLCAESEARSCASASEFKPQSDTDGRRLDDFTAAAIARAAATAAPTTRHPASCDVEPLVVPARPQDGAGSRAV